MSDWLNQHDNDSHVDYRGSIALPSAGTRGTNGGSGGIGADGLNIPSKPSTQGVLGANTQAGRRWTATLFDVHRTGPGGRFPNGRPWTGELELPANPDLKQDPGFVTPELQKGEFVANEDGSPDRAATFRSVWDAPFTPLPKYFVFNYKRRQISFAYARMINDEQIAMDNYYEAAAKLAAGLPVGVPVEYGKIPAYAITGVLGSPASYIRNIKVAQAALAGDPWILGFHDEPNAELAKLIGYNERTGLRQLSYTPEPKGVVTAEQVLATPQNELMKMIAELQATVAEQNAKITALSSAKPARNRSKTTASSAPAGEKPAA